MTKVLDHSEIDERRKVRRLWDPPEALEDAGRDVFNPVFGQTPAEDIVSLPEEEEVNE